LVNLLDKRHNRPAIPEYPQIAGHIKQALDDVYYGLKDPKRALDDAAARCSGINGGANRLMYIRWFLVQPLGNNGK
jgi:multiple sugar transport system substrate-binding protein